MFAHTSGGTDFLAQLVAAGYCEFGSVRDGRFFLGGAFVLISLMVNMVKML